VPKDKGHKQYKTYLRLIDTGTSSSLINKEIVKLSSFETTISPKETKWVTQAGTFTTSGKVKLENYFLPQFTNKRKITSNFHMFNKKQEDTYDIIIGQDILTAIGFNILYASNKFEWENIQVDMVSRGHWLPEKISSFWKKYKAAQEESNITIIKPAEYQVANIADVTESQKHLTLRHLISKFSNTVYGEKRYLQRASNPVRIASRLQAFLWETISYPSCISTSYEERDKSIRINWNIEKSQLIRMGCTYLYHP
jgi:hypothetical protein